MVDAYLAEGQFLPEDQMLETENFLCKIWGSHGGDYDDYHLLGDDAVWLL
jgi:hypothetical protein